MTTDNIQPAPSEMALKSAEAEVRDGVAQFGAQHPEVLRRLERYVILLRRAGKTAQADNLEERASKLRQILGTKAEARPVLESAAADTAASSTATAAAATTASDTAASSTATAAAATTPAESQAEELPTLDTETPLFDSHGSHIVTEVNGHLYTPEGKYVGYWSADMEAYISKEGRYLGELVEENRLGADPSWRFKHLSFNRGYEGDRSGWSRAADVYKVNLPYGYKDVEL